MKKHIIQILILFFSFLSLLSFSQGCSDAGVCTVGHMGVVQFKYEVLKTDEKGLAQIPAEDPGFAGSGNSKNQNDSALFKSTLVDKNSSQVKDSTKKISSSNSTVEYLYPKYSFQLSTAYGIGDRNTSVITTQVEGNFRIINNKLFAQIKLPYNFINGNLGSVNGLGDVTGSFTYIPISKSKSSLSITAGIKIPTNNANLSKDSLALPMVYQTSLGSTDILLGAKYSYKKWDLTVGYQHAFNSNKNGYLNRSNINDSSTYNSYFESKELKRADDGICRINRNFAYKKINASAGLLAIYHLANDTYTNAMGERVKSIGSEGLTLNINLAGSYTISKKLSVILIYASPIVVRKARPDGLTRSLVAIIGLKYNIF